MSEVLNNFQVPVRCRGCPVITQVLEHVEFHETELEHINEAGEAALSGLPPETVDYFKQLFESLPDEMTESRTSEEFVKFMEHGLKTVIVDAADHADKCLDEAHQKIAEKTDNCLGRLTLRAVRDGAEYQVTTCGSRAFRQDENPVPAILKIRNHPQADTVQ